MPQHDALAPRPPRGRGRPKRTAAETELTRLAIQQAGRQVMAEHGYHGVSVELILRSAGLSRATFYRYFNNAQEVIELVLQDVNDRLIESVITAVRQAQGPLQKVEAGLLAWRRWGEETGPLLRAIFAEMHDAQSPAHGHRQRVLAAVQAELNAAAVALGRHPFEPLQVEAFVIGVEYLGYRFHFGTDGPTDSAWARTRQAMLRLAIGLLGGALEWGNARQLAEVLDIPLD